MPVAKVKGLKILSENYQKLAIVHRPLKGDDIKPGLST